MSLYQKVIEDIVRHRALINVYKLLELKGSLNHNSDLLLRLPGYTLPDS